MKTGVVLVAANMYTGQKEFIPLMEIGSITVIERVVTTFLQAGVSRIVLVSGERADEVEGKVSHMGVICLRDEDYLHSDMLASAKIGFSYLQANCSRIAFCPVDTPMFTVQTVNALFESKAMLISPSYQGRGGHPLVMEASLIPTLLAFDKEGGITAAMKEANVKKQWLPVEDEGTLLDIAKKEVSHELIQSHKKQMLHPCLKVSIAKEQIFFGPGTEQLLDLIEHTGSVRSACQFMHISYSKGWKMIRLMEEQWGHAIVERRQGGVSGGSSFLTEEGKELMRRYRAYKREVEESAKKLFEEYFILPI